MRKRRNRQEPRSCGGIGFTVTTPFTQGIEEIFDGFIARSGIPVQNGDVDGTFPLLGDALLNRRVDFKQRCRRMPGDTLKTAKGSAKPLFAGDSHLAMFQAKLGR